MARKATSQVIERDGKRGRTYALRFRAYGRREYITLGTAEEGWTHHKAEVELETSSRTYGAGSGSRLIPSPWSRNRARSRPSTSWPRSG